MLQRIQWPALACIVHTFTQNLFLCKPGKQILFTSAGCVTLKVLQILLSKILKTQCVNKYDYMFKYTQNRQFKENIKLFAITSLSFKL